MKTVTVQGEGTASSAPDQATFDVEVQLQGDSSKEIVASANKLMNDILDKLKALKIAEKDLQTQGYAVNRNYQYVGGKSKLAGYTVSDRLRVLLHNVDQVQDVMGALSDMESVQVNGPTFGFAKPDQLQIDALKTAVENAHAKAEALAAAAGAELGSVYSIQQNGGGAPIVRPMMMTAGVDTNFKSAPIEKGTSEVTAQVEVVYTLK
jgi:uncharacterized protein YggE